MSRATFGRITTELRGSAEARPQVLDLDPDGPLATAVRRQRARRDPAADGLDRDRHALGRLVEAQIHRDHALLTHRKAPLSAAP